MTSVSGANTLDEGNAPGLLTIARKPETALPTENSLKVQPRQDTRISAIAQGAFLSSINNIKTCGDDDGPDAQLLHFCLAFELNGLGGAAFATEIASLPLEAQTKSFIEKIGKGRCFCAKRVDRLGIGRADLSAKAAGYASFCIHASRLLSYLNPKTARLAAKLLHYAAGQ